MIHAYDFPIFSRHSSRATRISARVKLQGIEVVLPMHARLEHAADFLNQHALWFLDKWQDLQDSHQKKLEQCAKWPITVYAGALQTSLTFDLILKQSRYYLAVRFSDAKWSTYDCEILMGKKMPLAHDALAIMQRWLKDFAYVFFLPKLVAISNRMQLKFDKLRISFAKTCWGSCNSKKVISLNASLLFCEPQFLDYVMIHECAHLTHMNHSPRFWNLVASYCKDYGMISHDLKHQAKLLPIWLFQSDCLQIPESLASIHAR
jgi:predicted metal-dependent hydrolase